MAVRDRILDFIEYQNKSKGTTVIFTSHDLISIERICNRIIIIDKGSIIFDGNRNKLKDIFGPTRTIIVQYDTKVDDLKFNMEFNVIKKSGHTVQLEYKQDQVRFQNVVNELSNQGNVVDISISGPSMESVVKKLIGAKNSP